MELYSTVYPVISPLRSLHGNSVHWTVMLVKVTSLKVIDSGMPLGAVNSKLIHNV